MTNKEIKGIEREINKQVERIQDLENGIVRSGMLCFNVAPPEPGTEEAREELELRIQLYSLLVKTLIRKRQHMKGIEG